MLDLSYFQNSGNVNTQTFTNAGTWVTWQKPRGAKLVNILCIGAGGGGGGGNGTTTVGRAGGAGGGSGGIVRAQFQAITLPDILYIQTGTGGTGGNGGTSGSVGSPGISGSKSFVTIYPDTTTSSSVVVTSGNLAAAGGGGGGNAGSTAGSAETVATIASATFLNLGTFIAVAGIAGGVGSTSTTTNITPSSIVMGGAGGNNGSTTTLGNGYTATGFYPIVTGGTNSGTITTSAGRDGIILYEPVLAFMGGTGGAVATSGVAQATACNGGNGAYGCGGGGGAATPAAAVPLLGGNGGKGGDGLVIITTSF